MIGCLRTTYWEWRLSRLVSARDRADARADAIEAAIVVARKLLGLPGGARVVLVQKSPSAPAVFRAAGDAEQPGDRLHLDVSSLNSAGGASVSPVLFGETS